MPADRKRLEPLIRGGAYPPHDRNGLPNYVPPKNMAVKKRLAACKAECPCGPRQQVPWDYPVNPASTFEAFS